MVSNINFKLTNTLNSGITRLFIKKLKKTKRIKQNMYADNLERLKDRKQQLETKTKNIMKCYETFYTKKYIYDICLIIKRQH